MRQSRGSLYLLTGLVIGIVLGLVYTWGLRPAIKASGSPATLRQEDKDTYRGMIALAFMSNKDLVRARARLELLGDQDVRQSLAEQAQRLAGNNNTEEARALLLLFQALNQGSIATPSSNP